MKSAIVLSNKWALGDTVCLSALPRDIHRAYPGKYDVYASGHYLNVFWRNNPYCKPFLGGLATGSNPRVIELEYGSGIREAGLGNKIHFLSYFHKSFKDKTGIDVPVTEPKGVIVLSSEEAKPQVPGRYWVVVAGGKMDMTAKVWAASYWQQTVDMLAAQGIKCVQAGGDFNKHFHPRLDRVVQMVGKTKSEREFFSLIANAEGVICGITAAQHIAAVFDKPCVVIAGGREEPWWEAYSNVYYPVSFGPKCSPVKVEHAFLHTVGLLDCGVGNLDRGCWKDRAVPLDKQDHHNADRKKRLCRKPVTIGKQGLPLCLSMISPDHVVEAVMKYYTDGQLPPIGQPTKKYSLTMANGSTIAVDPNPPAAEKVRGVEPGDDRQVCTITKWDIDHSTYPPTEKVQIAFSNDWLKQLPQEAKPPVDEPAGFAALDHPDIGGKFTLFVLGYGDHLDILERCIGSIIATCPASRFDLRVALNQPSRRSLDYVQGFSKDVVTRIYLDRGDRKKYPAMREMFHDLEHPITTPYVCWFDDDSWCRAADWMVQLAQLIAANHLHGGRLYGPKMIHDLSPLRKTGARPERWFQTAPWWRGLPLYSAGGTRTSPNGSQIVFASGGFWALATHVIREQDIPDSRLNHNGGDATIGCQVTQGGYKVVDFSPRPKKIIAWSDAARRGFCEPFPWAKRGQTG